jgi:PEP-CTERM motif
MRVVLRELVVIVGAGFMAVVAQAPANATPIEYDLTVDNCSSPGCGGGTGPGGSYGTVVVSDLAALPYSGIHVEVSLYPPSEFVNTAAGYSLMFSLTGDPTISIDNLTTGWLRVTTPSGPYSAGGDFGQFDYAIYCSACGSGGSNPQPGPFSFDIFAGTDLSVLDFTDGLKITGNPADPTITPTGIYFVTDILGPNGLTGRIGAPNGSVVDECVDPEGCAVQVPEPGTLPLFLVGTVAVAGLGATRRRKKHLDDQQPVT